MSIHRQPKTPPSGKARRERWGSFVGIVLSLGALSFCRGEPDSGMVRPPASPAPAEVVAYYRLRVEFSTTSDWSRLQVLAPRDVLAVRVTSLSGDPAGTATNAGILALHQPLANAQADNLLAMKVDYAIAPGSADRPMEFLLERGSMNGSLVRVFRIAEEGASLLGQKDHRAIDLKRPHTNPLDFSVDLSPLRETPPLEARVGWGKGEPMRWEFYDPARAPALDETRRPGKLPLGQPALPPKEALIRYLTETRSRGVQGLFIPWPEAGGGSDQGLKDLLEAAAQEGIWISIFFRTPGDPGVSLPDENKVRDVLAEVIERYGDAPAFFKLEGRPLMVVWATEVASRDSWRRIFSSLEARGSPAVCLAVGIRQDEIDVFMDPGDDRIFPYPGVVRSGLSFALKARSYSLLAEKDISPIWMAIREPRFRRWGGESRMIWDLAF